MKQKQEKPTLLSRLDSALDEYFKNCKHVSVTHDSDGAVAIFHLAGTTSEDPVDEVRVGSTTANGGSYWASFPYENVPLKEQIYISSQHFKTPAEAFCFILDRAMAINQFFKH